jgi:hypothetical protein
MSSLANEIPPVALNAADPATQHVNNLGKVYEIGGKLYRLVKAAANISACANKVLVTSYSGNVPAWTVNTTTTANSPLVAGVVVPGQLGSDGTTGLVSGDYFLIQVGGIATPLTVTGSVAAGTGLVTTTTAGQVDAVSATYAAITQGVIMGVLKVASNAGAASAVQLQGLI